MNIAAANQRRFKVNMKAPDAQYVWPFYPLPPAWKLLNPYWEAGKPNPAARARRLQTFYRTEAMVYRSDQSVNWKILPGGTAERATALTCSGQCECGYRIDILVIPAHRTEVAGTSRSDDNVLLAVAPQ